MGHVKPDQERRLHERIELGAHTVVFHRGDPIGRYALQNLSAGGALITGKHDLRRGHLVHVLLDLQGDEDPMSVSASIHEVRKADQGVGMALTFPCLSPDQEDRIHDAVLRILLKERFEHRDPVLVFEPRARVRNEIEAEIRSFGLPVESTSDLMEAIQALEGDDVQYAGLVIHSAVEDPVSMDVVEFFARKEDLRIVILPEPGHAVTKQVERLSKLPHVNVPDLWNRTALQGLLAN